MSNSSVSIVIPAYNESNVLDDLLVNLCRYTYRIILVDDGSSDNTYSIASKYPIHLIHHSCNLGQGAALQTGIDYVLQQTDIKVIVTFDADGQHDPAQIMDIIDPILSDEVDVVLGSRFLRKGSAKEIPLIKSCVLQLATLFTKLTIRLDVTDTHNGFRAFSRKAAQKIRITQNGMSHATQILKQIKENKLKFCEIPVNIRYTDYSKNKGQSILNSINILWDSFFGGLK